MDDNTHLAPAAYQAFRQGNFSRSIELFEQRIEEFSHVNGKDLEIHLLMNDVAVCHILYGNPEKAMGILQECKAFFESAGMPSKVAMTIANMATAYEKLKNVKEATLHYTQALANFPEFDDNDVKYFIHHNLSLLYLRRFNLNKAVLHRLNALEFKEYLTIFDKIIQLFLRVVR